MGLFDGFEAGWNSFKNNELKAAKNIVLAPSPITKFVTNPEKAIKDPSYLLPLGNNGPRSLEDQWNEVKEDYTQRVKQNIDFLTSPNPLISAATGNSDDIISTKPSSEKWNNVLTKTKDTVKDTVNNVTKGVGEALPIIAIGGAAVLVVSLLLGRR